MEISYGGESGFNQAIELAAESLSSVKLIQEKKQIGMLVYIAIYCFITYFLTLNHKIGRFFDEVSRYTGMYFFGADDTAKALELGAVKVLICWENLNITRYTLKIPGTGDIKILHLTPEQQDETSHFTDKEVD